MLPEVVPVTSYVLAVLDKSLNLLPEISPMFYQGACPFNVRAFSYFHFSYEIVNAKLHFSELSLYSIVG